MEHDSQMFQGILNEIFVGTPTYALAYQHFSHGYLKDLLLLSPYNFHKLLKMKNKETKLPSMLWSRGCTQVQSFWNEAFLHLSKVQGFK